jgi:hypothetical protein
MFTIINKTYILSFSILKYCDLYKFFSHVKRSKSPEHLKLYQFLFLPLIEYKILGFGHLIPWKFNPNG